MAEGINNTYISIIQLNITPFKYVDLMGLEDHENESKIVVQVVRVEA